MIDLSIYFGAALTLIAYVAVVSVTKRFKSKLINPLLIAILVVIAMLLLLNIDYVDYYEGAQYVSVLLTPATICLAIPLYQHREKLKLHLSAILIGILVGSISSLIIVLLLSFAFELSREIYLSLLPKSITTAIGVGISQEIGGLPTITIVVILLTGVLGSLIGETIFKLFKIKHPIAQGLALGTSAHAMGTSKALEIGEIQGAMSSLSIAVAGIITVILSPLFALIVF